MSQISLGRKNFDDDLEPIAPTKPVESRTVTESPDAETSDTNSDRVCFSVYPSFIAACGPEQLQRDAWPHIATPLSSLIPSVPKKWAQG